MTIADEMKNLAGEIETSYGARVAAVKDLIKETHQTLEGFQRDHRRMAEALKTDLAQGESRRLEAFKALNADIKRSVEVIFKETARLLSDFSKEQKEMAVALRKVLAEGESARLEDFRAVLPEIRRRQKERVGEVQAVLRNFRRDQGEAHGHWQNLAKVMAAKRAGKRVPIAEVPKEAEVPKRVEEVAEVGAPTGMTYREFFAYHHPRLGGGPKERVRRIGQMWGEYRRAGKS